MKMNTKETTLREKLRKAFIRAALIASISGIVGLAVMKVIDIRYTNLMQDYGFTQGDVGRLLAAFIRTDGNVRNAISNADSDLRADAKETAELYYGKIDEYFAVAEESIKGAEEQEKINTAKDEWQNYKTLAQNVMENSGNSGSEIQKAQKWAAENLDPVCIVINDELTQLWDMLETKGANKSASSTVLVYIMMCLTAVSFGVSLYLSLRMGNRVAKNISEPMKQCADRLVTLAQGDLQSEVPEVCTGDEVEKLADATKNIVAGLHAVIEDQTRMLGKMADGNFDIDTAAEESYQGDFAPLLVSVHKISDSLSGTLQQILEISEQVSMASVQLAEGSQVLAEGATDQASSVEELLATIDEVNEQVEKNAQGAASASQDAGAVGLETENGNARMTNMTQAMNEINTVTKRIVEIIDTIESIAAQTNLLSLNASIEAARAGEAGRGFAVVADEIRDLAEQSAAAANNTRELIERALQEVENGNHMAEQTAEAFQKVTDGIQRIVPLLEGVRNASAHQAEAIRQLDQGVAQINGVVQNNSAAAQESSATSEELSAQAETLHMLVKKFVLKQ